MGSVATEKERGTAGLILTKPACRGAFLVAKLVAIAGDARGRDRSSPPPRRGSTRWSCSRHSPSPGSRPRPPSSGWRCVAFAAITFLGSTLTRSALAAAGIGVAAFIVIGVLQRVPVDRAVPAGGARGAGAGTRARLAAGRRRRARSLANVALVVAMVGLSWLSFRRQEL